MTDYVKRTGRVYVPCHAPQGATYRRATCCAPRAAQSCALLDVRHVACHAAMPRCHLADGRWVSTYERSHKPPRYFMWDTSVQHRCAAAAQHGSAAAKREWG